MEYAIEMNHITKRFAGIVANDDITIQLKHGEILALLGENGAGKSTLMSVLFGMYQPEEGEIRKDGQVVKIHNPNDATALHIGMVHQHFKLVENFTILQNIVLGEEPMYQIGGKPNVFKVLSYGKAEKRIKEIMNKYGLHVDLNKKVEDTSVEMQQKTEIIKMLYRNNDILIFDEPTAVLTEQETQDFLQILINLKKEGKSIIFITHKLNEIMAVCDRVSVIRKGKYIGTREVKDTNPSELASLMVGRKINPVVNDAIQNLGKEVLRIEHLYMKKPKTDKNLIQDVSFNVREGEIVCLAGIDGNGQQEMIYGITGIQKTQSGSIFLSKANLTNMNVRHRNKAGIAHIPEDRHKYGLVLDYSLNENMVLERYFEPEFSRLGFIRFKEIKRHTEKLIKQFDIRSSKRGASITRTMSGGNQQKAIIAREIARDTSLLIAVQPTRGLDIGAIESIHKTLLEQRRNGKAILLVSLELDEVYALADRILVMYEGQITGEFKPSEVSREELGLYMSGAKHNVVNAIKEDEDVWPERYIHQVKIPLPESTDTTIKAEVKPTVIKRPISIFAGLHRPEIKLRVVEDKKKEEFPLEKAIVDLVKKEKNKVADNSNYKPMTVVGVKYTNGVSMNQPVSTLKVTVHDNNTEIGKQDER